MKIINKKKFPKVVLNENVKPFVIYVTFFILIIIYLFQEIQIALLLFDKVIILDKYLDYLDVFLKSSVKVLPKYIEISKSAISMNNVSSYFIGPFID